MVKLTCSIRGRLVPASLRTFILLLGAWICRWGRLSELGRCIVLGGCRSKPPACSQGDYSQCQIILDRKSSKIPSLVPVICFVAGPHILKPRKVWTSEIERNKSRALRFESEDGFDLRVQETLALTNRGGLDSDTPADCLTLCLTHPSSRSLLARQ